MVIWYTQVFKEPLTFTVSHVAARHKMPPHLIIHICSVFFFYPMPHMSFMDFVVFPPGHGRSVTEFRGWDAHEARLRCPDDDEW